MYLGKAGWLSTLLQDVVTAHARAPVPALSSQLPEHGSGRARARAYLRRTLRESGLLYGTPADGVAPADGAPPQASGAPEEQLFLAVVRTLARMALDVAELTGAAPGPRREQLLLLFAVLTGLLDDADAVQRRLPGEAPRRLWSRVEAALERRALSLAGDPGYGLVLHNGALYADAQMLVRQAIDFFSRGFLPRAMAQRRLEFAARQKALLVDVLTALACVEREPSFASRRAILRQVEDLGLPGALEAELRAAVRQSFERRRPVRAVAATVRSGDQRHFLLEQTLLASLVDGQRSRAERDFIQELASALHVSGEELKRLELQMAEFYAKNRRVVDVFTVSEAAGVLGEDLVAGMQDTLEKNFQRLMTEVRETGELSLLLAKAARRQPLSAEERSRMRAQLIDVAKAIPALAIFAAPGGMLLLIALAKVLPFNLLPSAFHEPLAPALAPGEDAELPPPPPPSDR